MKLYYICTADHFNAAKNYMGTAHYITLDGGLILLCTAFSNDHLEQIFAQQPGVSPLPHPMSGENISNHPHKAMLQKHFPQLKDTHGSYHVGLAAATRHPLMGPRH